jgi:hypothetical protein
MQIVFALDTYDDLFSDFDIRGYEERALSKDFLDELYVRFRRHWDKSDLGLVFLLPKALRSPKDEKLIVGRLRDFFVERRDHHAHDDKQAKLKSLAFVAIGLGLSMVASLFARHVNFLPLFNDFLLIPSWFFVWNGFDCFLKREELGRKKKYYLSLSACGLAFRDLEGKAGSREDARASRS